MQEEKNKKKKKEKKIDREMKRFRSSTLYKLNEERREKKQKNPNMLRCKIMQGVQSW